MLYATEMVPEPREAKNEGLAMIFGKVIFAFIHFSNWGPEQMENCQVVFLSDTRAGSLSFRAQERFPFLSGHCGG